MEWLQAYFSDPDRGGVAAARDVLKDGGRDGFNDRLMQRARKRAGVRTGKGKGGWTWSLDPTAVAQGDKESTT